MRPTVISDDVLTRHPGFRRIIVSGPNGDLLADGSTPEKAKALEAMVGIEGNWPVFIERWMLEPGELEALQAGAQIELRFWTPQLPVHALGVVQE